MAIIRVVREWWSQFWDSLKIILMMAFVLTCAIFIVWSMISLELWFLLCFLVRQLRDFLHLLSKAETWTSALEVLVLAGIIAFEVLMELAHTMMIVAVQACLE